MSSLSAEEELKKKQLPIYKVWGDQKLVFIDDALVAVQKARDEEKHDCANSVSCIESISNAEIKIHDEVRRETAKEIFKELGELDERRFGNKYFIDCEKWEDAKKRFLSEGKK